MGPPRETRNRSRPATGRRFSPPESHPADTSTPPFSHAGLQPFSARALPRRPPRAEAGARRGRFASVRDDRRQSGAGPRSPGRVARGHTSLDTIGTQAYLPFRPLPFVDKQTQAVLPLVKRQVFRDIPFDCRDVWRRARGPLLPPFLTGCRGAPAPAKPAWSGSAEGARLQCVGGAAPTDAVMGAVRAGRGRGQVPALHLPLRAGDEALRLPPAHAAPPLLDVRCAPRASRPAPPRAPLPPQDLSTVAYGSRSARNTAHPGCALRGRKASLPCALRRSPRPCVSVRDAHPPAPPLPEDWTRPRTLRG